KTCEHECLSAPVNATCRGQESTHCPGPCRHYQLTDDNITTCVHTCINQTKYLHYMGYACISVDECTARNGSEAEAEVGNDASQHTAARVCVKCQGRCAEECPGASLQGNNLGEELLDCKKIKGSLNISISGGHNVTAILSRNLGKVREVTGFIRIYGSNTLYSLNFLSSLEVIGGEELLHGKYALYVLENRKLQELFNYEERGKKITIKNGSLFFAYNPLLCTQQIYDLAKISGLERPLKEDVSINSNGIKNCKITELKVLHMLQNTDFPTTMNISWTHEYGGTDRRRIIGYKVYHTKAEPGKNVSLFKDRDACSDELLWKMDLWEYHDQKLDAFNITMVIRGLEINTRYAFYVETYTTDREPHMSRSKIHYNCTAPSNPSRIEDLQKLSEIKENQLNLKWNPPIRPNGEIVFYMVEITRAGNILNETELCKSNITKGSSRDMPIQHKKQEEIKEENSTNVECCECPEADSPLQQKKARKESTNDFENHLNAAMFSK
ncbi:unnamed protein product, partial [Meganyctiphanes norvegica]